MFLYLEEEAEFIEDPITLAYILLNNFELSANPTFLRMIDCLVMACKVDFAKEKTLNLFEELTLKILRCTQKLGN